MLRCEETARPPAVKCELRRLGTPITRRSPIAKRPRGRYRFGSCYRRHQQENRGRGKSSDRAACLHLAVPGPNLIARTLEFFAFLRMPQFDALGSDQGCEDAG
jgi:hypothetical protein